MDTSKIMTMITEHPLVFGLITFVLGAIIF